MYSLDSDEQSLNDAFMKDFKAYRQLKTYDSDDLISPQDDTNIQSLIESQRLKVSLLIYFV